MKGKAIYLALAAILGVLIIFVNFVIIGFIFLFYLYLLSRYKSFGKIELILILFIFIFYSFIGFNAKQNNKTHLSGKEQSLFVELRDAKFNGDLLVVNGIDKKTNEKLLIHYRIRSSEEKNDLYKNLQYGVTCTLSGKLEPPSSFNNPNVFNYQKYLSTKQIFWIFYVNKIPIEFCHSSSPTLLAMLAELRKDGVNYVLDHFPEPTASLAIALLFGDQSMMDHTLMTSYQSLGIVHLLAISGLQVTLLTGVLFYCGLRIGIVREKMMIILMVFLPIYAILTGATPSVVRAVIMMLVMLISLRWGKQRLLPLDALCYVLFILLFFSPYLIYDIGFQLSFSACAALLLSSSILLKYETSFMQLLLTSYIAQLATLPFIFVHFFEVSLLAIAANILFVPLFSIFLTPFFFIAFLFHPFCPFVFDPLIWLTNQLILMMNEFMIHFSAYRAHMFILGKPNSILLILLSISIIGIFFMLEERKINPFFTCSFIIFPIIFISVLYHWSPYGEITFLDVGQGDSIFIKLPYNRGNYLIDTGGNLSYVKEPWQKKRSSFEVGKDVVLPFLKSKGITRLDKLIITHGDMDHIGGASALIDELTVKEILLPKIKEQSELEVELIANAKKAGIKINFVSAGLVWREKENWFKVLAPSIMTSDNKNNQSIVLYGKIGGLSWLFTGDLEQEGERLLVQKYSYDIDVLKVGHHGSKTSSSEPFIKHFRPEVAIISVGEDNRYGHPHREVIERYKAYGTTLLRTDQNGAISYFFRGGKGTFSVMLP